MYDAKSKGVDIQRHVLTDADWKLNNELREASGTRQYNDPLVCFMYHLIRDHLPAGVVEGIACTSIQNADCLYSNGFLADYANNIAERLRKQTRDTEVE